MMAGITRRWTKKSLVVLVVVLGVASYILASIWTQPLARGNDEQFTGIPGHNPANQKVDITGVSRDTLIWPYVDGGVRGQCCELDEPATWSARDFRPIYLAPGHQGA